MNGENGEDKNKFGAYQQMTPDLKLFVSLVGKLLIRLSENSIRKFL
ncbi:MAG: hypothetical protein GY861_19355 [bacterium]|nr:hypothetical protein [bacterium]